MNEFLFAAMVFLSWVHVSGETPGQRKRPHLSSTQPMSLQGDVWHPIVSGIHMLFNLQK